MMQIIIANPWFAYSLVGFGAILAAIILWRAKNGDAVSLFGLNVQSNSQLKVLEKDLEKLNEDSKQKSYVITSLNKLASEVSRVMTEPESRAAFEDQRRRIYNYLLSCVVAVMAGKKANNPKVCIFVDAGDGTLKVHEAAAHSPDGMRKLRLPISDSAAGYTFHTGEAFFSGEIHTPGNRFKVHPKAESTYHSLICVPIKSGDRVIGVLSVTGDETRSYTSDEKNYLTAFASVLSPLLYMELYRKIPV
ncbi:GAF domain-containing protein [Paludifilum halophilum]|nr:GAF domain-containing protein [Paludifilum halophilum]